jgi:hypothetical protein
MSIFIQTQSSVNLWLLFSDAVSTLDSFESISARVELVGVLRRCQDSFDTPVPQLNVDIGRSLFRELESATELSNDDGSSD